MSRQDGLLPALGDHSIDHSHLWRGFSWIWENLRREGIRSAAFLIFIGAISEILSRQSDLSPLYSHLRIEVPLLLGLYWALSFAFRPGWKSQVASAVPFALAYIGCDIFFIAYGNVLRISDFQNVPELFKVLTIGQKAAMYSFLGATPVLLLVFLDYRRYWRMLSVAGFVLAGIGVVEFLPDAFLRGLQMAHVEVETYSDAQSVNENGRLTMMLYFEASRRSAIKQTAAYRERSGYEQEVRARGNFIEANGNRRNVYLVVLESWVDPNLFRAVTYSKDPANPDFKQLVGDKLGFSISPVFGGGTAQAEFEALCGVPARGELSEIDFDDFTGHAAGCLPGVLRQAGYSTYATNVYQPDYFNSVNAYTGAGFDEIYYPKEYARDRNTYLSISKATATETYLFDGDLFDQNLAFIARTLRENPGKPIFNYVLTMYGHEPHDIDTSVRPMVLSMIAPHDDQQLLRSANQYWYRTQAIASYIRGLIKLDPNSLIIMMADHVPGLDEGTKSYKDFRYLDNVEGSTHMNRIVVVENGVVVQHETIHHYDVPALIYDYVTGEKYCAQNKCRLSSGELEDRYKLLISRAAGPK